MSVNVELSRELADRNFFSAGRCFYNAQGTVQVLADRGDDPRYIEGYAQYSPSDVIVFHAWVEVDGQIVDPTWIYFDGDPQSTIYVPVAEGDTEEICAMEFDEMGGNLCETCFDHYREYLAACDRAYQAVESAAKQRARL